MKKKFLFALSVALLCVAAAVVFNHINTGGEPVKKPTAIINEYSNIVAIDGDDRSVNLLIKKEESESEFVLSRVNIRIDDGNVNYVFTDSDAPSVVTKGDGESVTSVIVYTPEKAWVKPGTPEEWIEQ